MEVRQLTAYELNQCEIERNKNENTVQLFGGEKFTREQIDQLADVLGLYPASKTPPETARRIEMLVIVFRETEPGFQRSHALKMATYFPTFFHKLTDKIMELTSIGGEAEKKPAASTQLPE